MRHPTRRAAMLATTAAAALISSRARAADDRLRLGQATTSLSFLPVWAARADDTFKAQGLALEWAAIPGGDPAALAALDSGDLDVAAVGSDTALQAISKGQPFELIYPLMSKMSLELVVSDAFLQRTGVAPGDPLPKRIAALKGATVGVSAIRGTQDRAVRWVAGQGGLDPASDLKVAMVGGPPAIQAALEHGQIDAYCLSPPEGALTEASGAGRILIRLGDEFPKLKGLPFLVLVAKTPFDDAKRVLIVRTTKALTAASEALRSDPAAAAGRIQTRFFPKLAPAALAGAVASMADGVADPRLTAAGIATALTFAAETGLPLGEKLDAASGRGKFWSDEFVVR